MIKITAPFALCAQCSNDFVLLGFQYSQDTCDNREQGNTLYESGSQDHVRTDVVRSFRLTGDAFYSTFTDLTDTDTGTNCS